ncbi:MAG: hypothetical protein ACFE9L_07950 [Candidatus Hodarchaeota archaeon]
MINATSIIDQEWPTHSLRKALTKLTPKLPLQDFPLGSSWTDITTETDVCAFAEKYEPRILLQGQGLISRKCKGTWGGMFYRVLEDEKGSQRVIQYIYVWVRQQLPFTFWNWVLPLFALLLISIYTSIDTEIYSSDLESVEGIPVPVARILTSQFHPWFSIILSLIIIFVFGGFELWKTWRRGDFSIRVIIFPFLGVLYFGCIVLELLLDPIMASPFLVIDLNYVFHLFDVTTDMADLVINIGVFPLSLFLISIGSIFILYYQSKILEFRLVNWIINILHAHFSHDMDYAPIYVYLIQSKKTWIVDTISWDRLHYVAGVANRQEGELDFLEDAQHPIMILKGNWHSFQPFSSFRRKISSILWYFHAVFLILLAGIGLWLTVTNLNVFGSIESYLEPVTGLSFANLIATVLYRLFYPTVLFWCVYYLVTRRKRLFLSPIEQDLCQMNYYHLSQEKCQLLWSLPPEPQFQIQIKLQNPLQVIQSRSFRN